MRQGGGKRSSRDLMAAWPLTVSIWLLPSVGQAETALVAVAGNFAEVMEKIEADFERESPHGIMVTVGSTGKLYAQIVQGAPFDVLLAADRRHPELLEGAGFAVPGARFTYATGRLVLWSADPDRIPGDGAALLRGGDVRRLSMANPELAPYGAAARETLRRIGVYQSLRERIVLGENVGQAYALVATGNADVGLVALSSVLSRQNEQPGSRWEVPENLHEPITQDAVLLIRAEDNSAARDLLAYLRRPEVRELMHGFGYGVN